MSEHEGPLDARCATCGHRFEDGDVFIEDTSSGFLGLGADPDTDRLMAEIFGGRGDQIRLCENCTESGGKYDVRVFHDA